MQERIAYSACPLCDSASFAPLVVSDCSGHVLYDPRLSPRIHWMQCRDCTHIFTDGYYSDEANEILFSRTQDGQRFGHKVEENRAVSARMIDRVLPFADSGRWLDIGIGNGSLLMTAQEYGYHPVGVDLRQDNVAAARQFNMEAYCQDVATLELAEPCSVVSLMDVLEHAPFPKQMLAVCHRLLRPGGILFASMPNTESVLWFALNQNKVNPYWGELEHFHNFSRSRLYALLEQFGFEPRLYGVSSRYRVGMEVIAIRR